MWELLKNKGNPPKNDNVQIKQNIQKEIKKESKPVQDDDTLVLEALKKAKELAEKKVVTEKVNFAHNNYVHVLLRICSMFHDCIIFNELLPFLN